MHLIRHGQRPAGETIPAASRRAVPRAALWLAALALFLTPGVARAAEGGSGDYIPGLGGVLGGLLPAPGSYFTLNTAIGSQSIERTVLSGLVRAELEGNLLLFLPTFTGVTKKKILGGTYGYSIMVPFGTVDISASLTGPLGNTISGSQDHFGLSDIAVVPVMLGWHQKKTHETLSLSVIAPTGDYTTDRVANTGKNHWAFDTSVGFTYFDPKQGHELSAVIGYMVNFTNPATDYDSGEEFHVDFRLAQWFHSGWSIALAGYYVQQVTGDTGSGALLGSFKGMAVGLGPMLSYHVKNKKNPIDLSVKYLSDLTTKNRLHGQYLWISGSYTF